MQNSFKHICFLVTLVFLVSQVRADEPAYIHMTVKDGLLNSTVYSSMQDSRGFMWFCTETGVNRYDGRTFEKFTYKDGLADNEIFRAFEDSKNRIWFLSYNGRLSFYYKGKFYNESNTPWLAYRQSGAFLIDCTEDKNGDIWFSTSLSEMLRVHDGHVYKIGLPFKQGQHNSSYPSANLFKQGDTVKKLVVEPTTRSIYLMNGSERTLKYIDNYRKIESSNCDSSFRELMAANINIFLSGNNNLFLLQKNHLVKICLPGTDATSEFTTYFVKDSTIWIGTAGDGVYKLSCHGKNTIEHFLRDETVSHIQEDNEGNMWFTTLGDGVFCVKKYANWIVTIPARTAYGIAILKDVVLAGDDKGDLEIIKNHKIETIVHLPGKKFNRIHEIFPVSDKDVVVVSDNSRVYKYNINTHLIKQLGTYSIVLPGYRSAYRANDGGIWACTQEGISKLDKESMVPIAQTGAYGKAFTVATLADSIIYLATSRGLFKKSGNGTFLNIMAASLLQTEIVDLKPVNGLLWIGTHGNGVFILRGDSILLHLSAVTSGLVSDICQKIFDDGFKYVWVATNQGVSLFDRQALTLQYNLSSDNGLISADVKNITASGGYTYIATAEGINIIRPDQILTRATSPKVYVTKVREGNEIITDPGKELSFDYFNGFVNIYFTSINYESPLDVQYEYKFNDLSDWQPTRQTEISLLNLRPGSHHLLLRARKFNSDWGKTTVMHIVVSPLWYQSPWFYGLLIIGATATAFYLFQNRLSSIRMRAEEKNMVNQKMLELEGKSLAHQMNPHFIFNSLNTLQQMILVNEQKEGLQYLQKFAILMRRMLENSRKSSITLTEEIEFLDQYLMAEQVRFNNSFQYSIIVDPDLLVDEITIPPMLFQPLLENAVKHGVASIKNEGIISLRIEKQKNCLVVTVEDNGVGVHSERNNNSSMLGKKESTALKVVAERLRLITNANGQFGTMEIFDKSHLDNSNSGTIAKIYIPL